MPRTPDYQRIVDDITAQIDSGQLRRGDRIASMRQMRRRYGVSSQPVRMALTVLHARGRTEGRQGVGVFVLA